MSFGCLGSCFCFCLFVCFIFFVFWLFKGCIAMPQDHGNKGKKAKKTKSKNNMKEKITLGTGGEGAT